MVNDSLRFDALPEPQIGLVFLSGLFLHRSGVFQTRGSRERNRKPGYLRLQTAFMCFMSMTAGVFSGGCLCGSVRYEATGQPYNVTHCHCADCRRSSGAPFVTWASFARSNFQFTQGQARELSWAGRLRSFCPGCGTPLTFVSASGADEIDVTVCTLDQPEAISPADHTWVEDRLPWICLADGLPIHTQKRPNHAA